MHSQPRAPFPSLGTMRNARGPRSSLGPRRGGGGRCSLALNLGDERANLVAKRFVARCPTMVRSPRRSRLSVGALAGDLARSDKRTRALVSRKIRDNIELLATLIRNTNEMDRGSARSRAILAYCALVGAIGMARAVSDEELSREILKTVAQRLKNPAS